MNLSQIRETVSRKAHNLEKVGSTPASATNCLQCGKMNVVQSNALSKRIIVYRLCVPTTKQTGGLCRNSIRRLKDIKASAVYIMA